MKKVISVILSTIILVSSVLCVDLSAMANQINITNRAEWLSQLVKTFDMTVESDNYPDNYFSDLSDDSPYYRDILVATEFGIVDIEAGDPVNPEGEVTREFAAQTLNFCLKYVLDKDDDFEYSFADYEQCKYPDDDQIAVDHGWFELDENNNFCPNQTATLDEAEIMIDEAKETIKADEVDEHYESTFEYQKGVVEIDKDSSFEFVDDNNLILYDTSYDIKTGTSFVAYVNEIPVTYTAKNVTKESDCLKIEYVEPENKEDIIKNVDMQAVSQISTEDFVPGKGFEVVDEPQSRLARFKSEKFSVKLKANLPLPAGNSVEFNVTLKNIVLSTKYNTKDDSFEAKLDFDYSFNFSGQFSSVAAVQDALDDFDSIGEIPIAGVGYFSFAPEFDITGSITHSNSYSATIGCSYDAKGLHNITSFKKKSFSITFEGAVKLGLKAEVGVKILIAKVGFYASIGVTAKGTASTNKNAETNTDLYCLSLDAYLYFNLGVDITLGAGFISKDLVFEYEVFNKKNSPIKLGFHLENGKSVPACTADSPNKQKYVTKDSKYGSVTENDGSDIVKTSDFTISVNSDGKTATITKYTGSASKLDIPSYINGYKIVDIGDDSFRNCNSLASVTIPNSVTSIGQCAFYHCYNLASITISNSVKSLGSQAFDEGPKFKTLYFKGTIEDWLKNDFGYNLYICATNIYFDGKLVTDIVIPDTIKSINKGAFAHFKNLKTIVISNSVTSIGDSAFKNCTSLTNITIPNSVTSIGYWAFSHCKSLTSVTIPNSVTSISDYAFYNCSSLTNITIPNSVTSIGGATFYKCTSLTSITIPNSVTRIDYSAFENCTSLTNITIPNSVTSIGNSAFANCAKLASISIGNSVTNIGIEPFDNTAYYNDKSNWHNGALYISNYLVAANSSELIGNYNIKENTLGFANYVFSNCTGLIDITIPDSVKYIGLATFNNCTSLKSATIGNGVTRIDDNAFYHCTNLISVIIGNSVASIGEMAFYECKNLKSIAIPSSVTYIYGSTASFDNSAFSGSAVRLIYFKGTMAQWKAIKGYNLGGIAIECIDGVIGHGKQVSIGNLKYAIYDNYAEVKGYIDSPENILIPENIKYDGFDIKVTSINSYAFNGYTRLKSVIIGNNVESIGYTFSGCSNLLSVIIGNSVTSIMNDAFSNCSKLTNITIPNSVTRIDDNAFYHCTSLTSITIPSSVKSIGFSFTGCDNLKIINYNGSKSQWESIDNYKKVSMIIECTDGIIGNGNEILLEGLKYDLYTDYAYVSGYTGAPKRVIIPKNIKFNDYYLRVERIYHNAFLDCTTLEDVFYSGTESEWNDVSVWARDSLNSARIHYNFVPCTEVKHNAFGEWKVIKNATCTEDGLRQRVCSFDDFVQTQTVPALGHDFSGNAEYCKHGCGTRNPNYVPPTVTTQPATQPTNTTTVTEPQPTQAPTVVTTTNAQQPTTKAPVPTSSTTVAPTPTEPTTVTTTVAPTTTTQVEQTATAPNAVDTTQSTTKPATKTTKAKETVDKKQKKARVKKATPAKASLTITWAKVKGVKGYEIQLATDKKFKKNLKKVTIKKQKTTKTTVKKLKSKTKYYVRIRTYKTKKIKGKNTKVYSSWSKTKTVKTK